MKLKGWKELEQGAVIVKPGNTVEYKSGKWRTFRPIIDKEKCIKCMTCFDKCKFDAIF